ncbi:MAG: hypothetical protein JXR86_17835 [Spirochaetales bacterium]|nr:hypothetical protein [Spirochaetales bacterium]
MKELKIKQMYRSENSKICIDIKVEYYREVFHSWDFSPLLNRDLDDDLFEYLEECTREIPRKYPLKIVMHMPEKARDEKKEELNTTSFRNFFQYKMRKRRISRRKTYNSALRYALYGLVFIGIGYFAENLVKHYALLKILREGVFIGGWVLFWELFSTIFFTKNDLNESIQILQRLSAAEIEYRYN